MAKLDFETGEHGTGGSGPQMPASRHYRKARHDRGAETRQRLILAALDAFGRFGFDAASTRDIAKRADANLAAIVYHFGSKESLHRAVADHVIEQITRHKQAHYDDARALLAGDIDKQSARDMLQRLIRSQIENMLGEAEAELWSRFIMREQMEPTSSFDSVYDHLCQAQDPVSGLIGVLFEIDPNSDEAIMQTSALIGQVFIFLVGTADDPAKAWSRFAWRTGAGNDHAYRDQQYRPGHRVSVRHLKGSMTQRRFASLFVLMLAPLVSACGESTDAPAMQGYVEGEYVLIGPEAGGRLTALSVVRGDHVAAERAALHAR